MLNSTVNDIEGELQPNASSSNSQSKQTQGNTNQVTFDGNDIQNINITCDSVTFTTDVVLLESIKILFPISNAVFKGRHSVFDELSEYLAKTQIAVICGMAGIGKTECSKQFAWNNSADYGMKLWLDTDTTESIQRSIHEIARKLSITVFEREVANIINDIYDYFENRNIFTLFVFDNANDKRSINHLLPAKEYHDNSLIHIIITSQNNKWGKRNKKDIPIIELNPLEVEFAVDVFREIIEDNFDNYKLALWEKLSSCVNEIPLALQISAAYIRNEIESIEEFGSDDETFSLQDYIKKLEDELHLIIDEPFPDDSENAYPRTIYIAVSMTLEKIKLQSAFDMLYGVSYLSPNHINQDILGKFLNEESIRKSLEILSKYSLINTNSYKRDKKVGIHRLVQWVLRYHQEKSGREVQITHYDKIFTTLLNNHPSYSDHYSWMLKHEVTFKEVIRDYYILKSDLSKVFVLISHESFNSLSLICESLERSNTKEPTHWIKTALDFGSVKSFQVLHQYLDKVNKELKCLKTLNDGILLMFVMQLKENAEDKFLEAFREILRQCNDVNVIDNQGRGFTPIMLSLHRGLTKITHLLLETKKVDLNRVDRIGWTIFHYLIGAYFLYNDNELSPKKFGARLIKLGFNVGIIDQNGRSLLHHACKFASPSYVEYLIEKHGLNVNLKDNFQDVPLFVCFEYEVVQIGSPMFFLKNEDNLIGCIDLLTKHGADVDIVNKEGKTILHLAAQYYPLVVEYLLDTHKMDVNAKDKCGVTPADEIRKRDPCYDDVETSKVITRIAENPQNVFCSLLSVLQPSPLNWTMNIHKGNFKDFSCSYEKITYTPFTPVPSTSSAFSALSFLLARR